MVAVFLLAGCGSKTVISGALNPADPPPTVMMAASPANIVAGQTTQLSWNSSGATSVMIDNGVGKVAPNGSMQVTPSATTSFHATASGPNGTAVAAVTVQVEGAVSLSLQATPESVTSGQSVTLTWTARNATSVAIDGVGSFGPSGSAVVTPTATTTYTATATEDDGSTAATVTVNVTPVSAHAFILVEENHSYSEVIGSSQMPYLNQLAKTYGLATQYFGNAHPSLPNYFELTVGNIVSTHEGFTGTVTQDNIVRELLAAGKTWKCYAEDLPAAGYMGPSVGNYARDHNPFTYFSDVVNSSTQAMNIVPFTQLQVDYSNSQLPGFGFIVPNQLDNAHNGDLQAADNWLKTNIAPLVASPEFQADGILVIVFDESLDSDTTLGGGHVATVVVGPTVKPGAQVSTTLQHQSTLRLMLQKLGVTTFPGDAATAPDMTAFFQ